MVGFKCINTWFEQCEFCPVCSREMKFSDIQLLFWTTSITNDSLELENLEKRTKRIKGEIQNIQSNIQELEEKLRKGREVLAKNVSIVKPTTSLELQRISQPSLIHDRSITDGFRMHSMHHLFLNTTKDQETQKYGIQLASFNSLSDISFVSLHSCQIRDITSSGFDIITCSIDKTLKVTSSQSQQVKSNHLLPFALWSCTKITDDTIATGGDRGFLSIIDQRMENPVLTKQVPGPPINSTELLDPQTLLCLTAKELLYFNIHKGDFVPHNGEKSGGFSLVKCNNTPFYSVLKRKDDQALMVLKSLDQNKNFKNIAEIKISPFKNLIQQSLICYDDAVYAAVPNEMNKNFSLFSLSQAQYDLWGRYSARWNIERRNPVVSCLMMKERDELLVASLSSDHIWIYSVPLV